MDVLALTEKLISYNSVNPPGNEAPVAEYAGTLLSHAGFEVTYEVFGENRLHMIAEKGVPNQGLPLVFSGHFDTVPLGNRPWKHDPFKGQRSRDKIYGRGSSDMKAGLAAMICAAVTVPQSEFPQEGLRLIFTAGEELGCQGILHLVAHSGALGAAGALVIGEPTGNVPAIGHKGAIYLKAVTAGKTAHSSMPSLGNNAIYKAARAVSKIEDFRFDAEKDPLLGYPTLNVGKFNGGMNINSVPDHAEFTIDVRTTPASAHEAILEKLGRELGIETRLEKLTDLQPVITGEAEKFVQLVYRLCSEEGIRDPLPLALPFVTDGSVLQPFYRGVPTIIMGPGQPDMAHQTDEFCYISKIEQAERLYRKIITSWRNNNAHIS